MNIDRNTSLEELLTLWVKYSRDFIDKRDNANEAIKKVNEVKVMLDMKGIAHLEIERIEDSSYTVAYLYKGSRVKKEIQIKE